MRDDSIPGVVDRNIEALVKQRLAESAAAPLPDRIAAAITRFAGSMRFVCLHAVLFGAWIIVNLEWIPGVDAFDPSFVVLAMVASVEAIFISTFVLIGQNQSARLQEQRADLDLQISLLAEHEISRLISLTMKLAHAMKVDLGERSDLEELSQDVHPKAVLDRLSASASEADAGEGRQ